MRELMVNQFEQKESFDVISETLSTNDLIEFIYKGESLPQDDRFLTTKEGGVFEYFELKDISYHKEDKYYPVIKIGEKIVGLSELLKDPFNKKNLWIQFISIDKNERNNGYASNLAREIFDFAKKQGYSLEASHYTEDGFNKLRPVFERLSEEYKEVAFINKGKLNK